MCGFHKIHLCLSWRIDWSMFQSSSPGDQPTLSAAHQWPRPLVSANRQETSGPVCARRHYTDHACEQFSPPWQFWEQDEIHQQGQAQKKAVLLYAQQKMPHFRGSCTGVWFWPEWLTLSRPFQGWTWTGPGRSNSTSVWGAREIPRCMPDPHAPHRECSGQGSAKIDTMKYFLRIKIRK